MGRQTQSKRGENNARRRRRWWSSLYSGRACMQVYILSAHLLVWNVIFILINAKKKAGDRVGRRAADDVSVNKLKLQNKSHGDDRRSFLDVRNTTQEPPMQKIIIIYANFRNKSLLGWPMMSVEVKLKISQRLYSIYWNWLERRLSLFPFLLWSPATLINKQMLLLLQMDDVVTSFIIFLSLTRSLYSNSKHHYLSWINTKTLRSFSAFPPTRFHHQRAGGRGFEWVLLVGTVQHIHSQVQSILSIE